MPGHTQIEVEEWVDEQAKELVEVRIRMGEGKVGRGGGVSVKVTSRVSVRVM